MNLFDPDLMLMFLRRCDAKPCGRGWEGTNPPGCKRATKGSSTKGKPQQKEQLAKNAPKSKYSNSRSKIEALAKDPIYRDFLKLQIGPKKSDKAMRAILKVDQNTLINMGNKVRKTLGSPATMTIREALKTIYSE